MKICIENLDAIIEKYQPLLLSMANRFDIFDKNEAYIMARDMVFEIVEDFDAKKGSFGGYLKYRLYFYFLNECKKEKIYSLNSKDMQGVENAIKSLKKQEREILYLKYDKNFSHKEIARLLNLSPKSITNYHYLIIKKLRKYFEKEDLV